MLRCGLLGRRLAHSYSPEIHAELGSYAYRLYEKEPQELGQFLSGDEFDALNVTIPYKKDVMRYCASLSPAAQRIGSVNTIVRQADGTLRGYNTDADGFLYLIQKSGVCVAGKKALVFGSGGASATVCDVLRCLHAASVTVISRSGADNYDNLSRHKDAEILVNTTPVGMYPGNGAAVVDLAAFPSCCGVFDVVYNPARTALLLQAERLGIAHEGGLSMLVAQAIRASELFTGKPVDASLLARIERLLSGNMQNIVLIGMPGCGKSTVGAALAKRIGRTFYDADRELLQKTGKTAAQLICEEGESAFRDAETDVLAGLGKLSGSVIATGGGCVLREENYPLLHQNSLIIWLKRPLDALPVSGRPLSQRVSPQELYRIREPYYRRFADHCVENRSSPEAAVAGILEVLHEAFDSERSESESARTS